MSSWFGLPLEVAYGEPPLDLFPHHVVPNIVLDLDCIQICWFLGYTMCFDVIPRSCVYIMPISPCNTSRACTAMSTCLVEDNMLASCANCP